LKFIHTLWGSRRREQSQAMQERIAVYSVRPHPATAVQATPIRCPVESDADYDLRRMVEKDEMLQRALKERHG